MVLERGDAPGENVPAAKWGEEGEPVSKRKDRLHRQGKLRSRTARVARTGHRHDTGPFPQDGVCPDCGEQIAINGIRPWSAAPPKCYFCGSDMAEAEKLFRCSPYEAPPHGYDPDSIEECTCEACGMDMPFLYDPAANTIRVDEDDLDPCAVRAWSEAQAQVAHDTKDRARAVGTLARQLASRAWDQQGM
jgi:hypothetical protein